MKKNLDGTTKPLFSIGIGSLKVFIGNITKSGKLQCQDFDQRTVRDLMQYSPRSRLPADYTQLATEYEVHNLTGAGEILMDAGSTYLLDEGSTVII